MDGQPHHPRYPVRRQILINESKLLTPDKER
jgi:hypothetical protein